MRQKMWLGMEGSNLRFLIQSQASYHWTNPQRGGCCNRKATTAYSMVLTRLNRVKEPGHGRF